MPLGEPYLAEIRLFAFAYGATAPGGWQVCDGSQIDIDKPRALFSPACSPPSETGSRTTTSSPTFAVNFFICELGVMPFS